MLLVKEGQLSELTELFERYHVKLYNFFLRLSQERSVASRLRWTAVLAAAIGLVILAGEPRAIDDGAVIVVIYAAWQVARLGRRAGPAAGSVAAGELRAKAPSSGLMAIRMSGGATCAAAATSARWIQKAARSSACDRSRCGSASPSAITALSGGISAMARDSADGTALDFRPLPAAGFARALRGARLM